MKDRTIRVSDLQAILDGVVMALERRGDVKGKQNIRLLVDALIAELSRDEAD